MKLGNPLQIPVTYTMKNFTFNVLTELEVVSEEKDLGAWCTCELKPSFHWQQAVGKASQVLDLIRRSFRISSVKMFVSLFKK